MFSIDAASHYMICRLLLGFLSESIGNFDCLSKLVLNDNQLIKTIPLSVGSLVYLKVLDLSGNNLSGKIPKQLGKSLSYLFVLLSE